MTDFLAQLAARSRTAPSVIQPRVPGRFEPAYGQHRSSFEQLLPQVDQETSATLSAQEGHRNSEPPSRQTQLDPPGTHNATHPSLEIPRRLPTSIPANSPASPLVETPRPRLSTTPPPTHDVRQASQPSQPSGPERLAQRADDRRVAPQRSTEEAAESSSTTIQRSGRVDSPLASRNVDLAARPTADIKEPVHVPKLAAAPRDEASRGTTLRPRVEPLAATAATATKTIASPPAQEAASPVIQVTIGRIEVRAVTAASTPAPTASSAHKSSGPSLDEYLRQRSGGRP